LAITANKAHVWTVVQPTQPELKLRDHEYILATKMRLGLKPLNNMGTKCKACRHDIPEHDVYHFLSCHQKLSGAMITRHDLIVNNIAALVRMAGGVPRREPNHFHQKKHSNPNTNTDDTDAASNLLRTDLEILLGNNHSLVDVCVVAPTSPSYVNYQAEPKQLRAAEQRAKEKSRKHSANCSIRDATFYPFVIEAFGGMVKECRTLLSSIIHYASDNIPAYNFKLLQSNLYPYISIALQRGNAIMFSKCVSVVASNFLP
jgi:hypothetical protein